jgi:type I restriction enzyme M protein
VLSNDIFNRLVGIKLVDKYEAYQLLDNEWNKIKVDLEIIQTEGFEATKVVDPNMITRKKGDSEEEIQQGWVGKIMPFALVQEIYLKEELNSLREKENEVQEIAAAYEELLEKLTEEDKELEIVNEAKDAFVNAQIIKEAKQIKADQRKGIAIEKESLEETILKVDELIAEEKTLKTQIKTEADKLVKKTKHTIETLNDEQVYELLELKWIVPVVMALNNMPGTLIASLTTKVQALADKYAVTYSSVAREIKEAGNTLSRLMDDLEGNEFDIQGLNELKALLHGEEK